MAAISARSNKCMLFLALALTLYRATMSPFVTVGFQTVFRDISQKSYGYKGSH